MNPNTGEIKNYSDMTEKEKKGFIPIPKNEEKMVL